MECSICDKENDFLVEVVDEEHNGNEEPRVHHHGWWCKKCYTDEWNCNSFRYESKEVCAEAWEKNKQDMNKQDMNK